MKILIDAYACPKAVKATLYKATERRKIDLLVVANQYIRTPPYANIRNIVVEDGFNDADDKIVELLAKGDLVITADIPLADRVIKKGGYVLSPKGEVLDENNIGQRLAVRDLLDELRSCGMETGGPSAFSQRDRSNFVNALERFLTKNLK